MKALFKGTQSIEDIHRIAKAFGEKNITIHDCETEEIRLLLNQAGNKIASVHFVKRGDKSLRKMCYRLHVKSPSHANAPKTQDLLKKQKRKLVNQNNTQMTVFDVNKVLKDDSGQTLKNENGRNKRGAWRTIPLENVVRVCIDGITYEIVSDN